MQDKAVITAKYEFTEEERNQMGRELAQTETESRLAHEELDRIKLTFKERLGGLQDKISRLAEKVTNGYEFREFQCRVEYDRKNKTKHYRDNVSEKVVESRPFTQEDMQVQFQIAD